MKSQIILNFRRGRSLNYLWTVKQFRLICIIFIRYVHNVHLNRWYIKLFLMISQINKGVLKAL